MSIHGQKRRFDASEGEDGEEEKEEKVKVKTVVTSLVGSATLEQSLTKQLVGMWLNANQWIILSNIIDQLIRAAKTTHAKCKNDTLPTR